MEVNDVVETMDLLKLIITNILTALYQPFWFSLLLTIFILFFYLYCKKPDSAGAGYKAGIRGWIETFKMSSFFRKLFFLVFYTVMILFRTLMNRNMWLNPLSDVMGGWWIWKIASDGSVSLTTECFENVALMLPFIVLLFWTMRDKILKTISFGRVIWKSIEISFVFSFCIEMLQLFLRLGTWQLSDLVYNTLGGFLGGLIYYIGYRAKERSTEKV